MFNLFKRRETTFNLERTTNGRWAIVGKNGEIATYSRKRDAIRGADRRNILLTNV